MHGTHNVCFRIQNQKAASLTGSYGFPQNFKAIILKGIPVYSPHTFTTRPQISWLFILHTVTCEPEKATSNEPRIKHFQIEQKIIYSKPKYTNFPVWFLCCYCLFHYSSRLHYTLFHSHIFIHWRSYDFWHPERNFTMATSNRSYKISKTYILSLNLL